MTDPFAMFRAQCDALIKSQVCEPAGYVFEIPPKREMGQLACNVAFQLPRLWKNSPLRIAERIVDGMVRDDSGLVRNVQVAGPGFINFYLNEGAYARLVLDAVAADGEFYGRGEAAYARRPLIEHTSVNPNKPWHIGHGRNAVLGDTLARLFRFAGHTVEVQNYIDDTGKQVADMIFALRHFGLLHDDGTLEIPPGRKLDHVFGEVYARLYEVLGGEPALQAEAAVLDEVRRDGLTPSEIVARADDAEARLAAANPKTAPLPEREALALQRRLTALRAVSGLDQTASHDARVQEIGDDLEVIATLKRGAEEVQHTLERGDHRDLVLACVHSQLATAWRLGITYDLLTWEQDIIRSGLLEETLARIQRSRAVYTAQDGRKKGCLVIDMGNALSKVSGTVRTAAVDGTALDVDSGPDMAVGDETEMGPGGPVADEHSSEVVLVRSNGLPTYVGKDIANQYWKYNLLDHDMSYAVDTVQPNGVTLWSTVPDGGPHARLTPTDIVNVIGSHQTYPQQVVAAALRITGHPDLGFHHLAYGMVSARIDGADVSMSGRSGNTVPVDDVLDRAVEYALERVREKQENALGEDEMRRTAEQVAAAALRYVMVRYNPLTDIVLDPAEMVEFEGNTGAYLLYAYARIAAILRRAEGRGIAPEAWTGGYASDGLSDPAERDLIGILARLPEIVRVTQETLAVNLLAEYAYDLATAFSQFYNRCPILNATPPLEPELLHARLGLVAATGQVMRNVHGILGLELVERL